MQVIVLIVVLILLLSFIIYKVNNKFGTKEIIILVIVLIISSLVAVMMTRNSQEKVPNLFKEKYENSKNVVISKFTYERLNNKTVSSNTNFIYNFDYIIKKDNKEFVCEAKNVIIKKIQDEYVFENFDKLNEECKEN